MYLDVKTSSLYPSGIMQRTNPPLDHVATLIAQRRRETPNLTLDGMEIFARARRLDLLSRPRIEAVFSKYGIDSGEFDVLATLSRAGPPYRLRPTELFKTLMISSGGLTDRLRRLEGGGLIARETSPSDGRSIMVRLTPRGKSLIDRAFCEDMATEDAMLSALNRAERKQLAQLLAKLLADLERETRA